MLDKIIKYSLDHRLLILVAAVLLIVCGVYSARHIDVDVFPDLTAPTVVVMTDAHGMAPEEVERLVSFPIETAVNGAANVRRVRSTSMQGSSFVFVEFDWGMDPFKARQVVSEKLTTLASSLPQGLTPVMAPQSSVMGEILFVGLQVDSSLCGDGAAVTTQQDLRTLAEWVVKPAILATGGVSQVTIIGGDYKQYQVLADPVRMQAYGVTLDELSDVCASLGTNATGGVVRDYGNEYVLRGMARTNDLETLGKSLVKLHNGHPVCLADVADVRIGNAVRQGYASRNAEAAVILSVSKQPNVNTLKVTENIESNLAAIEKSLPADVRLDTRIFRQADFIESSVGNVGRSLLEGAVFVVIVLFLFLGSIRTTVISVTAIPLSLLGTVACLHLLGLEVNTMTLGGMCIAIGSLVDDAIIDVENVYKRLRQNHQLPAGQRLSARDVVFRGSSEIRSSIIHATFIIMITFVPLFFLGGLEGRMLKPLGVAYLIALFVSLVVAMTVTPLLCKLLLSSDKYLDRQTRESVVSTRMADLYDGMLRWSLSHRRGVVAATLALFLTAVVLLFTMGRGFLPDFNEGSLTIAAVAKPGISLEESNKIGNLIERQLLEIPEVRSTSRRTGRGELDEHSQATNGAEIDVNFELDKRSKEAFMDDVRGRLAAVPGIAVSVGQPLGHRIDHMVSGTQAAIAIKVFGNDLSELYMIGNRIKSAVADVEGLVDVSVQQMTETPQLQLRADRDKLAQYGITIYEFNHFVSLAFEGERLAEIYEGQRCFDLVLRLACSAPPTIEEIKDACIDTERGGKVPLSEVAEVVSVGGPNNISRENVQRKLVVSANVSGRDAVGVVDDIKRIVDREIKLPEGYHIDYGGQFANAKSASRTLVVVFVLVLLVIYMLLYTEFRNLSLALIVLLNLPLALIGGVLAVKLGSNLLSIPAIIGFITLFGIATRNGILLVARYQAIGDRMGVVRGDAALVRDVVLAGSRDRLNPIIMTALTTALSLIPMVLAASKAGNEIQAPMAVVVLGGLITSTFLNIFVVPIVYEWYMTRPSKSRADI